MIIKQDIMSRFPTLTAFSIHEYHPNVMPIEYPDDPDHVEWPVLVRWSIGTHNYGYSPNPEFVQEAGGKCVADYSKSEEELFRVIGATVLEHA